MGYYTITKQIHVTNIITDTLLSYVTEYNCLIHILISIAPLHLPLHLLILEAQEPNSELEKNYIPPAPIPTFVLTLTIIFYLQGSS